MRQDFHFSQPAVRERPVETFARLREQGPVVRGRFPLLGKVWFTTTYAATEAVLKDDSAFRRDVRQARRRAGMVPSLLQACLPGGFRALAKNMITRDGAEHRRLRSLVDQAFQRQSISQLRPRIETIVQRQLESLETRAGESDGPICLVEHLARPIPLAVICELLGLPEADRAKFKAWFHGFTSVHSVLGGIAQLLPALHKTGKYLRSQFQHVREHPRDGLINGLVHAEQTGDRLSEDELLAMVFLLLFAGHETTVHLISNSLLTLFQLPDVHLALQEDTSRIERASEEFLRYCSPAQIAKPRFVAHDLEFFGQPFKRGDAVVPVLAAANSDPDRFEDPSEFKLDRPRNYHLAFGTGPHVCLALQLARAENEIVLQQILTRWLDLQPAFDPARPHWARRPGMRSPSTLPVNLGESESKRHLHELLS